MITPNIRYFARFDFDETSKKTPKYVITAEAGYYPPMEAITGKNGKVTMYLMSKREQQPSDTPPMRLQAKDSLNFTGLKDYFVNGKLSGFAYGYPNKEKTYSNKNKENPFFDYKDDGYLFIIHQDEKNQNQTPTFIELIVLENGKILLPSYCKQLEMGGFDEALNLLREQAK